MVKFSRGDVGFQSAIPTFGLVPCKPLAELAQFFIWKGGDLEAPCFRHPPVSEKDRQVKELRKWRVRSVERGFHKLIRRNFWGPRYFRIGL